MSLNLNPPTVGGLSGCWRVKFLNLTKLSFLLHEMRMRILTLQVMRVLDIMYTKHPFSNLWQTLIPLNYFCSLLAPCVHRRHTAKRGDKLLQRLAPFQKQINWWQRKLAWHTGAVGWWVLRAHFPGVRTTDKTCNAFYLANLPEPPFSKWTLTTVSCRKRQISCTPVCSQHQALLRLCLPLQTDSPPLRTPCSKLVFSWPASTGWPWGQEPPQTQTEHVKTLMLHLVEFRSFTIFPRASPFTFNSAQGKNTTLPMVTVNQELG